VGGELAPALEHRALIRHGGNLARLRREHREREQADDDALTESEVEECGLEAAVLDHRDDRNDGERRARAEACSGDACGQAAPAREPLERIADARAIDPAGTDAPDDL